MTAGIKANVDGSAAIQVGGSDYITISSAGAVAIPQTLAVAGTTTLTGATTVGSLQVSGAATAASLQVGGVATNLYPLVSGTVNAGGTNPFPSSAGPATVDFTGIPNTAKRITVMFQSVSTNGTSNYVVRIGNTTITATGYVSAVTYTNLSSNSSVGVADTTGYILNRDAGASLSYTGEMRICLVSNFIYVATFNAIGGSGGPTYQGSGVLNLGSVLDRVRVTTLNGTDLFDAGSINVMWE